MLVVKRNGDTQGWDPSKIAIAVGKAYNEVGQAITSTQEDDILQAVTKHFAGVQRIPVDEVHETVENTLMYRGAYDAARAYISYRSKHMPDIFRKRDNILPYEYPDMMKFVHAVRQSHWIHDEYNYDQDVTDYKDPNVPQQYKTVYARCLLAISQIEVAVKSYWKDVDKLFPKHEFSMLAGTFDESECRHFDTYRNLLELVGLNDMFNNLDASPVLKSRSDALRASLKVDGESRKDILMKNIMFSSFIENVSLYSQFLILMAFSKKASLFKGTANGTNATSTEEITHYLAGTAISQIIIKENPGILNDDMKTELLARARAGVNEEYLLIDWLFDEADLPFITRDQVKKFIAIRMHESLEPLGITYLDPAWLATCRDTVKEFDWFSDKQTLLSQGDFFAGRETSYAKGSRVFTPTMVFSDEFHKIMGDLNVPLDR